MLPAWNIARRFFFMNQAYSDSTLCSISGKVYSRNHAESQAPSLPRVLNRVEPPGCPLRAILSRPFRACCDQRSLTAGDNLIRSPKPQRSGQYRPFCRYELSSTMAEGPNSMIMAMKRRAVRCSNVANFKCVLYFNCDGLRLCP